MIDPAFHQRIIENKDWATILFVAAFSLIAVTKSVFHNRFADFMKLIVSDKYFKVYRDTSHLLSGFTIVLFLVQLISFAFFIQLILNYFGFVMKNDWIVFIQILSILIVFVLSKVLIEKIIATSFNIEEYIEQFNLQKVSYRTYIGLLILPLDIIFYYSNNVSKTFLFVVIGTVLTINILAYLLSLKNYQNLLFSRLFYFILYLCALEIAPYYFTYYWFIKKLAH